MKTKTFYLIRHGQKESYQGDPELTELGHEQALLTAEYLKIFPISKVVASPLKRTQQTAEAIASALELKFETHPLLRERINWGDDPDQTWPKFIETWIKSSINRNYDPPFGDSSIQAGERVKKAVLQSLKESDEQIAFVTHGGVITDFLRNTFEIKVLDEYFPRFSLSYELSIQECSITELEFTGEQFLLKRIADTQHLKKP